MKPLSEVAPGLLVIQIPIQAVWPGTCLNTDCVSVFLPDSTTNMVGLGTYYQAGNAVACLQHSFLSFHTQKEHAFRKQSLFNEKTGWPKDLFRNGQNTQIDIRGLSKV